jgi:hypothetical protein
MGSHGTEAGNVIGIGGILLGRMTYQPGSIRSKEQCHLVDHEADTTHELCLGWTVGTIASVMMVRTLHWRDTAIIDRHQCHTSFSGLCSATPSPTYRRPASPMPD